MGITHAFTSSKTDGSDSTLVKPSDWNAAHVIGDGTMTLDASSSVGTFTLTSGSLVALTLGAASSATATYGHEFDLGSTDFADFTISNSSAGVGGPEIIGFHDSASPAVNDIPFGFYAFGRDSAANIQQYGGFYWIIDDTTNGSEDSHIVFRTYVAGAQNNGLTFGKGLQVGAPTGGDLGTGTINVATSISKNNTAYNNPDYVLEQWATGRIELFKDNDGAADYHGLTPLDELEGVMRGTYRLPGITDESGRCIFERSDIALEKIEEAYIYITQLHNRVKELENAQIRH